mgnify:CR=1 FL=1
MHIKKLLIAFTAITVLVAIALTLYYVYQNLKKLQTDKQSEIETQGIYFLNYKLSPSNTCETLHKVNRADQLTNQQKTLDYLLQGPTKEERDLGYFSPYESELYQSVTSVENINDVTIINFSDFSEKYKPDRESVISNISDKDAQMLVFKCGFKAFEAMISKSLESNHSTSKIIYTFNGDSQAFYRWSNTTCTADEYLCNRTTSKQSPSADDSLKSVSLLNDQIQVSIPESWAVDTQKNVIKNNQPEEEITIQFENTASEPYSCPQYMNVRCTQVELNKSKLEKATYFEMRGMVIEYTNNTIKPPVKIIIKTPYFSENAAGIKAVDKIINSIKYE